MASSNSRSLLLSLLLVLSVSVHVSLGHKASRERSRREGVGGRTVEGEAVVVRGGRRVLTSFKETPSGGNVTFECSPSGPCIACLYSEKNVEKYRCSETGYRIPLKCVESVAGSNEAKSRRAQKSRSALETTSAKEKLPASGSQAYITYRSCIPAVNEEKFSVLGFEGVIVGLLFLSSSVIYVKRKRDGAVSGVGAVRIPTNPRF